MDSSVWCSHEHTVIVRLGDKDAFTLESSFSTSDMLVEQVRVTRPVLEPAKQRVSLEGRLVGPRGGVGAQVNRHHMAFDVLPERVQALVENEFTSMGCGGMS